MIALFVLACIGLQLFHYVIYPGIVIIASRILRPNRNDFAAPDARISLIICAHNEAGIIGEKLANCAELNPLPNEVIVVDDGSEDGTGTLVRAAMEQTPNWYLIERSPRAGKAAAMNVGAEAASGDILVFSDASEMYATDAIAYLTTPFADSKVAVVSGSHRKSFVEGSVAKELAGGSEGMYWRYEDLVRRAESDLGATVATVGSMLAIRRDAWNPIPSGVVNDDAWIGMTTLTRGMDVRYARHAIGWEDASQSVREERGRRRRISAGRLRLLTRREIWPLNRPAVLAAFIAHKVLRLFVPLLFVAGLAANVIAVILDPTDRLMVGLLALQLSAIALAIIGAIAERHQKRWRIPHLFFHVMSSSLVTLLAIWDVIVGRDHVRWAKVSR
ncbi:glycosyltransferase [Tropicimonas marinistellae]|uniref:glycosyltransferase n=1 Tax=Tropicimonas marinistellae TaxID=1739787 RepID=UPI00082D8A9B|nr:glycosyltransferase [Tropicimonas marinistellae]